MKANLLALLATLFITHLSLSARIVNVGTQEIPTKVEADESFRLITFFTASSGIQKLMWSYPINSDNNATVMLFAHNYSQMNYAYALSQEFIFEGPGNLYVHRIAEATVEILPTSEMQKYFPGGRGSSSSSSASGEQKNVTVIPENTPSNVQITLEQSTDLVNWSVVQPGSFAPSTTKRFFRIRSEQE